MRPEMASSEPKGLSFLLGGCVYDWKFVFYSIKRLVIEKWTGQPFEANFMDLNNDGKDEIVVSYYDTNDKKVV